MKIAAFSSKSKEPIYYVKSDVFKFFPSIDQNELLSLVHDIVQRLASFLSFLPFKWLYLMKGLRRDHR